MQRATMNYLDYANYIEKLALVLSKEEILSQNSKEFLIFKNYLDNDSFEVFQSTTKSILNSYYARQPISFSINTYMFYQAHTQDWFDFLWGNSDEDSKELFRKELSETGLKIKFFDNKKQFKMDEVLNVKF